MNKSLSEQSVILKGLASNLQQLNRPTIDIANTLLKDFKLEISPLETEAVQDSQNLLNSPDQNLLNSPEMQLKHAIGECMICLFKLQIQDGNSIALDEVEKWLKQCQTEINYYIN